LVDQPYDRDTESAVFADGRDAMLKHDVLQRKTLTFLSRNISSHGFISGFDGQNVDRTDLKLKVRVEHRLRDLELIRGVLLAGYAAHADELPSQEKLTSSAESPPPQSVVERFKENWFIAILLVCAAVAAATWKIADQLLVRPRDEEIARLKVIATQKTPQAGSPLLPENRTLLPVTGVLAEHSVTTTDGSFNVRINRVSGENVSLDVTVEAEKPQRREDGKIGGRVVVAGKNRTYYIDLHGVRGNTVDLSVSSGPPTGDIGKLRVQ